ncbi:MAG: hypothetical protein LC630_07375 [Bacteroidales bacterium]|nr:hypothetical protein [Bacteroidales bacterium]
MADKHFSIELNENTRVGRSLRIILGVACLIVTAWFIFSVQGTAASVGTAWIAMGFLLLFGLWLIGSGLGLTERYITIGHDRIVLRQDFYRPPVVFTSSSLTAVEFKPVVIDFYTDNKNVRLRLGTYYPGRTAAIMEAVEEFCVIHSIEIKRDNQEGTEVET